tara:strand:- start:3838 stop:4047 length:210 start_codon:yes stop_codon:yes gene_type:complete
MKKFNTAWGIVTVRTKDRLNSTLLFVPTHLEKYQIGISLQINTIEASNFGKSEADFFALKVRSFLQVEC